MSVPFGAADVGIVMGLAREDGSMSMDHAGLVLTPDGNAICGTVEGLPAADHPLEWHSTELGLPVDWDAVDRLQGLRSAALWMSRQLRGRNN